METEITNAREESVRTLSTPLYNNKGWIKFFGIMNIIYGILAAVSIVGIIFAWLPIWMGVLINGAANNIEKAYLLGDQRAMIEAQRKLSTYFVINAILVLVAIIFTAFLFVMIFTTGMYSHMWNDVQSGNIY